MLTNMGRINSKSRKSLINTPKRLLQQQFCFMSSLDISRTQALAIQDKFREVHNGRCTTFQNRTSANEVKLRLYKYQGSNNKIKGFEKLDGMVVKR